MHWAQALIRGEYVSALMSAPGAHPLMVKVDWMHAVCLGVLQYALGHALVEAFRAVGGVATNLPKANEACNRLFNMLQMMCRRAGGEFPLGDLTIGMIQAKG